MSDIIPRDDTPKKRCPRCKELKSRTSENFGADKRTPDGLRNCCKTCRHIEREEALARNPTLYKERYQRTLPYHQQYEKDHRSPEALAKRRESAAAYARRVRERNVLAGLCSECGRHPHTNGRVCSECRRADYERRRKHADNYLMLAKKSRDKLRNEVLEAYGGKCACCGEAQPEFLAIDHVNNDGAEHRRIVGKGFYQWLRKNGYPKEEFQLLCHNCNCAKAWYGCCPHKRNS